jgi:ABC-2 type transport system ATP-binding protein
MGMKMRLALCRTLLLDRDIIFLDEPTLGLNVKSKKFAIKKLKNSGKTILLTSHDMDVVEKLCERIGFINHGKLIKIGTSSDIKKLNRGEITLYIELNNNDYENLSKELKKEDFLTEVKLSGNGLHISLLSRNCLNKLFSLLRHYPVVEFHEKENSLEDLFLKLI